MVLFVIAAGCLGWYAHLARVQRQTVESIQKAGGSVTYDWHYSDGQPVRDGHPAGPRWLQPHVGPDLFNGVTLVGIGGKTSKPTEDLMNRIGQLRRLENLSADFSSLGDGGLAKVAHLARLQYLSLSHTNVGDSGLENLKGLARLEHLNLGGTKITDAGLNNVSGLIQLKSLELYKTNVSDSGLRHLATLRNLRTLTLQETKVTDDGVAALQRALPSLRVRHKWGPPMIIPPD